MASSSAQPSFHQTLVFHDLSHNETIEDTVYALEHLTSVVDGVFARIDARMDQEKTRVAAIKSRVDLCQRKIDKIRGSTRAITVFSTAKFPAPMTLPSTPTLFSDIVEKHSPVRDIVEDVRYVGASDEDSVLANADLARDLQDIVTRVNSVGQELKRAEIIMEDQGLGPIPRSIQSVSSTMLFNSNINLYLNYQKLDNLERAGREKTAVEEKNKSLASAPSTLINGDALPDVHALDLLFKPQMGEMSNITLPENLPLDFIANIQFDQKDLPSIAPSLNARPNTSISQLSMDQPSKSSKSSPPPPPSSTSAPPPPPPSTTSNAPPPPPPPASSTAPPPPPPPATATAPPPPPPPSGVPPPPPPPPAAMQAALPPPPPAPIAAATPDASRAEVPPPAAPAPPANNTRVNLLDAIKGMGVDKLRSKEESAMAAKKTQKKVEEKKPLTMQDALKERLARRNNAISGKTDKEAQRRDSIAIQQARENIASQQQDAAKKPAPMLRKAGFVSVEDASDDDSIPKFRPTATRQMSDSDSDSDASDFSFESNAPSGGGGLLNANNPALSSMLKRASKKGKKADSDSDGEWDD